MLKARLVILYVVRIVLNIAPINFYRAQGHTMAEPGFHVIIVGAGSSTLERNHHYRINKILYRRDGSSHRTGIEASKPSSIPVIFMMCLTHWLH